MRRFGERDFQGNWGTGTHPSKRRLKSDRTQLTNMCRRIRRVVNRHIAHNDRRAQPVRLDFTTIDDAIDGVWNLTARYNMLLRRRDVATPVLPQFADVFDIAWNTTQGR
jgi:hypothetical protein